MQLSIAPVAKVVFISILIPIGVGIFVHKLAPAFAERVASPLTSISGLGVVACIVVVWISAAPAMWSLIGNGTGIALAAFVLVGLAVGHVLGGPVPQNRTALAIATASRHPESRSYWPKRTFLPRHSWARRCSCTCSSMQLLRSPIFYGPNAGNQSSRIR